MEKKFILTEEVALDLLNSLAKLPYYQSSEIIEKFRNGLQVYDDRPEQSKNDGPVLHTLHAEPEFNKEMAQTDSPDQEMDDGPKSPNKG